MTIQDQGGYLRSSGMDHEGIHVEYYDGNNCRDIHLLFDSEVDADEFINREFPQREASSGSYYGYGMNSHAPCGN